MKTNFSLLWLAAQFAAILAAPTLHEDQLQTIRQLHIDLDIEGLANVNTDVDTDGSLPAAAESFILDCGSVAVTAMCSGANNGAHCDAATGHLTIYLQGSCSDCVCDKVADCTGKCG